MTAAADQHEASRVSRPDGPLTRADVMRAGEVADLTGLPKSTVYQYAKDGRLPSRRKGKHRVFLRYEVEAWLMAPDATG